MKRLEIRKVLVLLLSVISILIFIVPHGLVYIAADDPKDEWTYSYVFDDIISIIVYLPFAICWFVYLLPALGWLKIILQFLMVAFSLLYLVMAFLALTMPIQDFTPYYGLLPTALIFPLLVIFLRIEKQMTKK